MVCSCHAQYYCWDMQDTFQRCLHESPISFAHVCPLQFVNEGLCLFRGHSVGWRDWRSFFFTKQ